MITPRASIVVLTYNRPDELKRCITELDVLAGPETELIVVDNASETDTSTVVGASKRARLIQLPKNCGASGRNAGMRAAAGEIVITMDDDVFGLRDEHLQWLRARFERDADLAAVNFRVVDEVTEDQINWVHHHKIEDYADQEFATYEITEGAVAFRKRSLDGTDLYPEGFFISHEGPDLAIQLMNLGQYLIYSPAITVRHAHAQAGRPSWRRYYYDTRNQIWLACRHYPLGMACRKLTVNLAAMFVYAVRDGYLRFWFKGVTDGLAGVPRYVSERKRMKPQAYKLYRSIERKHPSFWHKVKRRLFQRQVRI